ncbi:hypothetical protein QJS66_19095 [Kocuria rhizophila]|nr:hypothetical protein QJS66_19095 [Kocuria rhizophila]
MSVLTDREVTPLPPPRTPLPSIPTETPAAGRSWPVRGRSSTARTSPAPPGRANSRHAAALDARGTPWPPRTRPRPGRT